MFTQVQIDRNQSMADAYGQLLKVADTEAEKKRCNAMLKKLKNLGFEPGKAPSMDAYKVTEMDVKKVTPQKMKALTKKVQDGSASGVERALFFACLKSTGANNTL